MHNVSKIDAYRPQISQLDDMLDGDYNVPNDVFLNALTLPIAYNGKQPGDPVKGFNVMIDIVRGEGFAKGKTVPLSILLGTDCYNQVKGMEDWKELTCSTDFSV